VRAECGKLRSKLAKAAAAAKADREAHVAQLAELQSQSRRKESALAANTLRLTKTEKLHAKAGRECERLRVQLASHSVAPPNPFSCGAVCCPARVHEPRVQAEHEAQNVQLEELKLELTHARAMLEHDRLVGRSAVLAFALASLNAAFFRAGLRRARTGGDSSGAGAVPRKIGTTWSFICEQLRARARGKFIGKF
jgi:hypothetical protein